jgi:general secretion pathway protein H
MMEGRWNNKPEREAAESGFTLLELLLVLGIMAVASAIALPMLSRPAGDATLVATARKIVSQMRMARAAAIRDNRERTLTIDLARRRFWVDGVTAASSINHGIVVDFVTLEKELLSDKKGRLRFHVNGSSTGGNVLLSSAGRTVSIELDWMTGHASIKRAH